MSPDLIGGELSEAETRLLAVYDELKALCAEDLRKRLANAHEGLNFRIERAGAGDLPRFELKAKRTVDNRDAPIGAAT